MRACSGRCLRRCADSRARTLPMRSPRSSLPSPLEGRRLWFAGIGGAGMSGYAALARAWGAHVRGWDRVKTLYLDHLEGIESVPHVVRGDQLLPYDGRLAVPGLHNRWNAACALAALELAGVERGDAEGALAEFTGVGRRLERKGEAGGVEVFDDYAHNPAKIAAALDGLRGDRRLVVLFQPHLFSRTRHVARELATALAAADAVAVTDVYPAREQPIEGVTGKLVVDALAEVRPGMPLAWTPTVEQGAAFLIATARAGDRLVTVGAGDVDRAAT